MWSHDAELGCVMWVCCMRQLVYSARIEMNFSITWIKCHKSTNAEVTLLQTCNMSPSWGNIMAVQSGVSSAITSGMICEHFACHIHELGCICFRKCMVQVVLATPCKQKSMSAILLDVLLIPFKWNVWYMMWILLGKLSLTSPKLSFRSVFAFIDYMLMSI